MINNYGCLTANFYKKLFEFADENILINCSENFRKYL